MKVVGMAVMPRQWISKLFGFISGKRKSQAIIKLEEEVKYLRSKNSKLMAKSDIQKTSARNSIGKLQIKNTILVEKIGRIKETNKFYKEARRFSPLYRQGLLANGVRTLGDAVKADCYISLLPSTLPAAFDLQRQFGGLVFCDNVENIDVHKHSLAPNWDPVALQMVNDVGRGSMEHCDGLLTIGEALAKTLGAFGRPTFVLKNFREFAEPVPNGKLRTNLGIPESSVLLFASGNVVVGFEPVLQALALLPVHFHLLALVRLKPVAYEEEMLARVKDLGLHGRVHFRPFVEYDELASLASGADIGLITSDISNPNGAVGLPNRCFDYLTAGLPVVAPPMPDVKTLVDEHHFGQILSEVTADEWRSCIQRVYDDLGEYRTKAREARRALTWESQEEGIFSFLGRPSAVTMIGFRDLSRYQRYQRLARSLRKFGCKVNMVFFSENPDDQHLVDGVSYYVTGDRYGVGPGFRELTRAHEEVSDEA